MLDGSPDPRLLVGLLSSSIATILIGRYIWIRRRFWRRWELDRGDRIVMLFVLVLLANAGISLAYTKDVIMSPAGYFYAAAFFVACRHYVDSPTLEPLGTRARRLAPGIGTTWSPRPKSQASATTYGDVACFAAIRASVGSDASRR